LNQKYGPFEEKKDDTGKLIMPEDRPLRETDGEAINHREPPTRVRYPMKRITVAEMRKRVRNMLEYVGRVQVDEARREDRSQRIKIPEEYATRPKLPPLEEELNGNGKGKGRAIYEDPDNVDDGEGDVEMREPSPEPAPLPSSAQLLVELTRDLIAFQEAFETGDFSELSFVSPMPPPDERPSGQASEAGGPSGRESEQAVEAEAGMEVDVEVGVEGEAEAEVEAEPEPEPEPEVEAEVEPEAEVEAEAKPEAEVQLDEPEKAAEDAEVPTAEVEVEAEAEAGPPSEDAPAGAQTEEPPQPETEPLQEDTETPAKTDGVDDVPSEAVDKGVPATLVVEAAEEGEEGEVKEEPSTASVSEVVA
jgi:hypothetical protein